MSDSKRGNRKIEAHLLIGDAQKTAFMQSCDVWEKFKVFGTPQHVDIEVLPDGDMEVLAEGLVRLTAHTQTPIVAVYLPNVKHGAAVMASPVPGRPLVASDGSHWGFVSDWLKRIGATDVIEVKTSEQSQ